MGHIKLGAGRPTARGQQCMPACMCVRVHVVCVGVYMPCHAFAWATIRPGASGQLA